MVITVHCPHPGCGKALKANSNLAGRRLKCPACGQAVQVPTAAPAGAAPSRLQTSAPPDRAAKKIETPKAISPADLTPLELEWTNSPLLRQNAYQLNQQVWVSKYGPSFNITMPGTEQVSGQSVFKVGMFGRLLGLFNMHSFLPGWMEVSDQDRPLFRMKQVKLVNNRYDIYSPTGAELLSSIKTVFSMSMALRLLDAQGQDTGEVVGADLLAADKVTKYFGFNVKTSDGAKLGDITSVAFHYARLNLQTKGLSVNAGYVGTVARPYAADPRVQVLMLAATIVAMLEGIGMNEFNPMKA